MAILTGVLLTVFGLVGCFFGKQMYRVVLALTGFIIGYYGTSGLLQGQSDVIVIIASIVAGLIGAFIFWSLYKLAYVIFGLGLGLSLGTILHTSLNMSDLLAAIVVVVLGLIGAFAGNILGDLMIRLSTAFSGAAHTIGGVAALTAAIGLRLPLADPTHGGLSADSTAGIITIVAVILLGAVGFFFQTRNDTKAAL
jgi:hypothetical protein